MNPDSARVSEDSLGSLKSCLVEGDPDQRRRLNKIRRRAILLSVVLQSVAVIALFLFPLLGQGERIPVRIFTQPPPYRLGTNNPSRGGTVGHDHHPADPSQYLRVFTVSGTARHRTAGDGAFTPGEPPGLDDGAIGTPDGVREGIEPSTRTPPPYPPDNPPQEEKRRLQIGHLDPSHLIRRIEPTFPPLAVGLRRETRVELHAIITTDGTISSLQVLSGDPLFYQSALEAVRQWQYTPTLLNGQPVEVDTHITVIYSLSR